jgi:hypothetical protein
MDQRNISYKKVTAISVCYFFCFLFSASKASIASTLDNGFQLVLTPFSQQVEYKESEQHRIYNQEQGTLNGFKYQLNYYFNDMSIGFSGSHSKGILAYIGRTQHGVTLPTKTKIDHNIFNISLSKELIDLSNTYCISCGQLVVLVGGRYEQTNRDILSKATVSGLEETYKFSLAELGFIWHVPNFLYLDWMIRISHFRALNATMTVDFLSLYDNEKIPLNTVYANQAELQMSYPLLENMQLGFILNFNASKIEKSDVFPLYSQNQISGSFYQPKRTSKSLTVGFLFTANF